MGYIQALSSQALWCAAPKEKTLNVLVLCKRHKASPFCPERQTRIPPGGACLREPSQGRAQHCLTHYCRWRPAGGQS
jgi:hypothetical protein